VGDPGLATLGSQLVTVVVDLPIPARADEYEAAAQKLGGGESLHLVLVSSPGSGAFVHLLGTAARPTTSRLPDTTLVRSRAVWNAIPHLELSVLPPYP
jgi:hypothetical protein